MLRNDFTFTKRQLGYLCVALGVLAGIALFSIDLIDPAREGGIGPAQRIAFAVAGLLIVLGLSLIPLGDVEA